MALLRALRTCSYGVAKETFGLFMSPCKSCTKNLRSVPGSMAFSDCKNPAGFGYTSEGANQVRLVSRVKGLESHHEQLVITSRCRSAQ
jgi:hypothetical protein